MRVMKSMIHPLESTTLYEQHVPGGASAEYACFAQRRGQRADACADTSTKRPTSISIHRDGRTDAAQTSCSQFHNCNSGAYAVGCNRAVL